VVAREMFFKPFKLTADRDDPLSMVDASPDNFGALDAVTFADYRATPMSDFVKDRKIVQQQKTIRLRSFRMVMVGDAHLEGFVKTSVTKDQGYVLQYTIIVQDQ
jgi:hypothetical protein